MAATVSAILVLAGLAWAVAQRSSAGDVTPVTAVATPVATQPVPSSPAEQASPEPSATATTPSASPTSHGSEDDDIGAALASNEALVRIPDIGVDTVAGPVGLQADGAMQTPSFGDSGWYDEGPMPTAVGPAVVVAHVDGPNGPDVFARLDELTEGDEIVVATSQRTERFVVTRSEQYPKDQLPAAKIWNDTTEPALRLVTCGGSFDTTRRSYRDNIIVWAEPVDDA